MSEEMYNHHHHHEHGGDSREEIIALIKYMYNHNASHTNELSLLAEKVKAQGDEQAYKIISDAVKDFEHGNAKLNVALYALTGGEK